MGHREPARSRNFRSLKQLFLSSYCKKKKKKNSNNNKYDDEGSGNVTVIGIIKMVFHPDVFIDQYKRTCSVKFFSSSRARCILQPQWLHKRRTLCVFFCFVSSSSFFSCLKPVRLRYRIPNSGPLFSDEQRKKPWSIVLLLEISQSIDNTYRNLWMQGTTRRTNKCFSLPDLL